MVGRRVEQLYPRSAARRPAGEPLLEVTELAGARQAGARQLHAPPRRGAGHRRPGGRGAHRALARAGRPRPDRVGRGEAGRLFRSATPGAALGAGAGARQREPQGGGAGAQPQRRRQPHAVEASRRSSAPRARRALAARWIAELGVRCQGPRQPIGELSGGNQQKVAIARLLHHGVDVLLLDEPTRGIDVASKAQIYELIDALVAREQPAKAVIMVSSYLPELLGVCDRIAVMCRGRLGPARPAAELDRAVAGARSGAGKRGGMSDRPTRTPHRATERRRAPPPGACASGLAGAAQEPGRGGGPGRRSSSSSRSLLGATRGLSFRRPRQPRDDPPPNHHRGARRAGHDHRDRLGRHRSFRRGDHRARHRGHRRPPARRRAARCSPRWRGIAAGVGCGALNGLLVTRLKVVPFIVTLGTMLVVRGARQGPRARPEDRRARLLAQRAAGAAPARARLDAVPARRLAAVPARLRGRRAAALHAPRPARLRRRLERAGGAPLRHLRRAREAGGLRPRRPLRRHRRPHAVLPADRRRPDRRQRASSSTSSPPW